VVLYGCETWPLTLREEHRLRVFGNRVLRELHDFYCSLSVIRIIKSREMRLLGYVAQMGEKRNTCRSLVGKPKGLRLLGRPRYRWVNNIRKEHLEFGWSDVDWIGIVLVHSVLILGVP
jgi:hypothetical protein